MNLLNRSIKYLMVSIFIIVSIWSVIFYFSMLDEIYDSIDDGLDNYKLLILQKAEADTVTLSKSTFDESNYSINLIDRKYASTITDTYQDTLMYMPFEDDLEPVRMLTTAFEQDEKYYQLKIISSMVEEDDLVNNLFWSVIGLYAIIIFSILVINNVVLRKLWKPFYKILNNLKSFRLEDSSKLPEIGTETKEFRELTHAAQILINNSKEAYLGQKRFTENAAHELQTPLTTIIHKLELILRGNTLANEDAQEIAKVLSAAEKLTRLNKSLLLLTRIENKQFAGIAEIKMSEVVRETMDELEEFAAFRKINISLNVNREFKISANPDLIQILISNLIKNGIVHNLENGNIEITINEDQLIFKNSTKNDQLDRGKIFTRFYKGEDGSRGTGLGLALAKAICESSGMTIQYSFDGQHVFKISAPNKIFNNLDSNSQLFPE